MSARAAAVIAASLVACGRPETTPSTSPDGTMVLAPSYYDGTLVRLTVRRRADKAVLAVLDTGESARMKWVAGWTPSGEVLFYGADMGTLLAGRIVDAGWVDVGYTAERCAQLATLFARKYDESGARCRVGEPGAGNNQTRITR